MTIALVTGEQSRHLVSWKLQTINPEMGFMFSWESEINQKEKRLSTN